MKKKIVAILSMALALTVCSAAATPTLLASANAVSNPIVTDDFGDKTYTDAYNQNKWVKYGDEDGAIKQASTGDTSATLVFKNDANADNIFVVSSEKYQMKSVTFDAFYTENFDDSRKNWGTLNFIQSKAKSESMYITPLLLRAGQYAGNTATLSTGAKTTLPAVGQWVTFKYEFTGASSFNFYAAVKGEEFGEPLATVTSKNGTVYNDSYLAFAVSGIAAEQSFSVDNIVIEKADNSKVTEDFESMENLKFETVRKDTSKAIRAIIYSPDSLSFAEAKKGARLVAKNVVEPDESILTRYEVINAEFNVEVTTGGISFVYALSQASSEPTSSGVYEYVMTATEGKLLCYGENGEATEIGKNVFTSVGQEGGAKINVSIDKAGTMTVYENGEKIKDADGNEVVYEIEAYAGYLGFQAAEDNTTGKLDDVVINASTYFAPETKSLTNNFSTDYLGGEDTRDFYMTSTPSKTLKIENDKLCFDGCSDGTQFGTCYQYDNFILDYKLTDIYVGTDEVDDMEKTGVGRWFGLDIGRPNYDTKYSGSYLLLYFHIVLDESKQTSALNAYTTSGVSLPEKMKIEQTPIPMSLFRDISYDGEEVALEDVDEADAVCVRWVAENNVLKMYMKKACEIEYTLYATVTGIETNGYMALCCTGYTYLHLDDFSLANTSTVYTCASNEAPEKEIIEVEAPYDYNKYRDNDENFDKELNYLDEMGGCGSSVGFTILPALAIGALGYFVFRKKENK